MMKRLTSLLDKFFHHCLKRTRKDDGNDSSTEPRSGTPRSSQTYLLDRNEGRFGGLSAEEIAQALRLDGMEPVAGARR